MKTLINFFLFFSLFSFISCKDKYVITLLESTETLKLEKIFSIQEKKCLNMYVIDSLLLFQTLNNDSIFLIYDKKNMNLIREFGQKGNGPKDFFMPTAYNSNPIKMGDNYLFYDLILQKKIFVDIGKITLGENESNCIIYEPLDKNILGYQEMTISKDNKIAGVSAGSLFSIYDQEQNMFNKIDYYPKLKIKDEIKRTVYMGLLAGNQINEVITFAHRFFDVILFYNTDGKLIREYFFSELEIPYIQPGFTGPSRDAKMYAIQTYQTPEFYYVSRANQPYTNIISDDEVFSTQILKFDWSGNLIKVYECKERFTRYCVDEKTGFFYFMRNNPKDEEFEVEVYRAMMEK